MACCIVDLLFSYEKRRTLNWIHWNRRIQNDDDYSWLIYIYQCCWCCWWLFVCCSTYTIYISLSTNAFTTMTQYTTTTTPATAAATTRKNHYIGQCMVYGVCILESRSARERNIVEALLDTNRIRWPIKADSSIGNKVEDNNISTFCAYIQNAAYRWRTAAYF